MRSSLYLGRRQYGKSTLAMRHAIDSRRGVVVFDPAACFQHWPESTATDVSRFSELINEEPDTRSPIIIFQPESEEIPDEFEAMFAVLQRKSHYALIVDECHWIQTPNWATPALRKLVRKPNQFDCLLLQTCHAPTDTWGRTRSLATDWYMFKLTRQADLEAIERECGKEVAELVAGLPAVHNPPLQGERRVYIHYEIDSAEYHIVDEQEKWYVNLNPPVTEKDLIYA